MQGGRGKGKGGGRPGGGGGAVYVGNLSWETSWQDLKDHFRAAGEVRPRGSVLPPLPAPRHRRILAPLRR